MKADVTQDDIREFVAELLLIDIDQVEVESISPAYLKITVPVMRQALIDELYSELRRHTPTWLDFYIEQVE